MSEPSERVDHVRFFGLDVHKHYLVACAVDASQHVLIHPQRVDLVKLHEWSARTLRPSDRVVLESTSNAWSLYDMLEAHVSKVVVANASLVRLIAQSRVKTDARDALTLAKLLACNLIPEVWVPPLHVRELRALVAHRLRLVRVRTQIRNRLHAVLHRGQIVPPEGNLFSKTNRVWWHQLPISLTEALCVSQELAHAEVVEQQIADVDEHLAKRSHQDEWRDATLRLIQIPGVSIIAAVTFLAAIGRIERFPDAKHLVGYAGLGASVHSSGLTHTTGRITKQGRRDLRHTLVEVAWTAVNNSSFWKHIYKRLCERMPKPKAIVAVARKLLVAIWHVLTDQTALHDNDPLKVAKKLMVWGYKLSRDGRNGMSVGEFVRHKLDTLGIGQDLRQIPIDKRRNLQLP